MGKQQRQSQSNAGLQEDQSSQQKLLNLDTNQGFSFRDNNDGIFSESINGRSEILLKDNKN